MQTKQNLIDALIEENCQQREIIRGLIREQIEMEKYWKNFALKLAQEVRSA